MSILTSLKWLDSQHQSGIQFHLSLQESNSIETATFTIWFQWEKLILISRCYKNHCQNQFNCDFCQIWGPDRSALCIILTQLTTVTNMALARTHHARHFDRQLPFLMGLTKMRWRAKNPKNDWQHASKA